MRFESDDTPVDVYVVTGTREVTQLVSVPAAPTSAMVFGASSFGPIGPMGAPLSSGISPYGSAPPSELIEARTTVEQRRFLCRTPCTTQLPAGVNALHLRTLGVSLGTESATIPANGARFRVRTATVGLYTIGQASLWVGAGLVITGVTLLVQSQTGCGSRGCSPWPGVGVTGVGVVAMAVGIPLVVLNARRLEALGVRSVALGLGSLSLRF